MVGKEPWIFCEGWMAFVAVSTSPCLWGEGVPVRTVVVQCPMPLVLRSVPQCARDPHKLTPIAGPRCCAPPLLRHVCGVCVCLSVCVSLCVRAQIFLPAITFLVGLVVLTVSGNFTLSQPPLLMDVSQYNEWNDGYHELPVPVNNQSYACIEDLHCGDAPAFDSTLRAMNSIDFSVCGVVSACQVLGALYFVLV